LSRSRPTALSARDIALVLGIGLSALAVIGSLLVADMRWSSLLPGGGSFFSVWSGARGLLFRGESPYGFHVALAAQEFAHGGATPPSGANPYWFELPLFLVPVFVPLAAIPDPTLARAAWALLGQLAYGGGILLTARLIDWRGPRAFLIGFAALSAFSLYPLMALLDGTAATMLMLVYCAILWAMRSGHDELAGALFVLGLQKWEVGLPFVILLSWRIFHEKRWRILAGLGMTISILMAISLLVDPGWPLSFLTATVAIIRSPHGITLAAALLALWPDHAARIATGITVVALATLVFEWAVGRDADFRHFTWMAFLVLAATPLLGMRTQLSSLVVLAPCFLLISAAAIERRRSGLLLVVPFLSVAFLVPWILAWRRFTGQADLFEALLFLFLPGVCVLGMYWTRWWFLRPARTWLDEIRAAQP
jgi:hypothetical protein